MAYRCSGSTNDELITNLRNNSLIFDDEDYVELNEFRSLYANENSSEDDVSHSDDSDEDERNENGSEEEVEVEIDNVTGSDIDPTKGEDDTMVDSELDFDLEIIQDTGISSSNSIKVALKESGSKEKIIKRVKTKLTAETRKKNRRFKRKLKRELERRRAHTVLINALRRIDRGDFVPSAIRNKAYVDAPILHDKIHISAPHIYGTVLSSFWDFNLLICFSLLLPHLFFS